MHISSSQFRKSKFNLVNHPKLKDQNRIYCDNLLKKVSKTYSFAIPILPASLHFPLSVAYLVVRLIDNIEDLPTSLSLNDRKEIAQNFLTNLDSKSSLSRQSLGKLRQIARFSDSPGNKELLENSDKLKTAYQSLHPDLKSSILNCALEMSNGFFSEEVRDIKTKKDYEKYCHYAAGSVGQLITEFFHYFRIISNDQMKLITASGKTLDPRINLAQGFGVYLQGANDLSDIEEDISLGFPKWPSDYFVQAGINPESLFAEVYREIALSISDKMASNILEFLPSTISYIDSIPKNQMEVRRFLGIISTGASALIRRHKRAIERRSTKPSKIEQLAIFGHLEMAKITGSDLNHLIKRTAYVPAYIPGILIR